MTVEGVTAAGANWWPLQMARELDDSILGLRTDERELGLWILKTTGEADEMCIRDRGSTTRCHREGRGQLP